VQVQNKQANEALLLLWNRLLESVPRLDRTEGYGLPKGNYSTKRVNSSINFCPLGGQT
jgi:hypothetical protein